MRDTGASIEVLKGTTSLSMWSSCLVSIRTLVLNSSHRTATCPEVRWCKGCSTPNVFQTILPLGFKISALNRLTTRLLNKNGTLPSITKTRTHTTTPDNPKGITASPQVLILPPTPEICFTLVMTFTLTPRDFICFSKISSSDLPMQVIAALVQDFWRPSRP